MNRVVVTGLGVLAPNGHRPLHILLGKRFKCSEYTLPALFPDGEQRFTRSGRFGEFSVPMAVWLLSIAGQEVRPSRSHVAGHMLHNYGNRIHLAVQHRHQLFIRNLRHRSFGQVLVITEQCERILQIRSREL